MEKEKLNSAEFYKDILDKLMHNSDPSVRAAVAEQGYRLDKLINDPDYYVRRAAVKEGIKAWTLLKL